MCYQKWKNPYFYELNFNQKQIITPYLSVSVCMYIYIPLSGVVVSVVVVVVVVVVAVVGCVSSSSDCGLCQ